MRLLIVLATVLATSLAHAGPKEDALQVVAKWAKAFGDADVDGIVNLHAPNATFFGTLDKTLNTQPAGIRKYFEGALLVLRPRTAALGEHSVAEITDSVVVVTGLDTVTGTRDGQIISAPGRVTFVLEKQPTGWKIVHFHRSAVPN